MRHYRSHTVSVLAKQLGTVHVAEALNWLIDDWQSELESATGQHL